MSLNSEIIKEAQGRKLRNVLAPVRFLGKKFLGMRSEIYSEALRTIEKADDIIRDSTFKQKVYLKDMKSMKKKLQGIRFAQAASAFLREQELILQIINKVQSEFGKITGNSSVTDINPYINKQIGISPEYSSSQKTEEKTDVDEEWDKERPGYIDRILEYGVKPAIKRSPLSKEPYSVSDSVRRQSNEFNGLIKQAFLEGWYWKKIKSGKEYAKAFDSVYSSLKQLFSNNVKLLEKLDELRSTGDPQEYFATAKNPTTGFLAITDKELKNEKFISSWSRFNELLIEQDKYNKEQESKYKGDQVKEVKETIEQKFDIPDLEGTKSTSPTISLDDISKKDTEKDTEKSKDFEIPDLESKEVAPTQKSKQDFEIPDLEIPTKQTSEPEVQTSKEPKTQTSKEPEAQISEQEDFIPDEDVIDYQDSISLLKKKKPSKTFEPEVVYEESLPREYKYNIKPIPQEEVYQTKPEYKELPALEEPKQLQPAKEPDLLPEHIQNVGLFPEHESEIVALIPKNVGEKTVFETPQTKPNTPKGLLFREPKVKPDESLAHNGFINQLVKMSDDNCSTESIVCYMLNYANEIDNTDNEYALKLTAIAEGALDV